MSRLRHPNLVNFMGLCSVPPCIITGGAASLEIGQGRGWGWGREGLRVCFKGMGVGMVSPGTFKKYRVLQGNGAAAVPAVMGDPAILGRG